ncbi:MAG: hypothetical protein ACM359_06330 [Bacillota bacterium]
MGIMGSRKTRRRVFVASAICSLFALGLGHPTAHCDEVTATWVLNGSGNWTAPANWSVNPFYPNNTPDLTYNVILPGQVVLDQSVEINNFTVEGGFDGPGDITVNGFFTWTGGLIGGGNGQRLLIAKGGMSINGTSSRYLSQRSIENYGHAQWISGDITADADSPIVSFPGATFDILGPVRLQAYGVGAASIKNLGTLRVASSGIVTLGSTLLANNGTLRVESGELLVTGDSSAGIRGTGTTYVAPASTLRLQGPTQSTFGSGFVLDGELAMNDLCAIAAFEGDATFNGTINQTRGTIQINGTATFAKPLTINDGLVVNGTVIAGQVTVTSSPEVSGEITGTGDFIVNGPLVWNGGGGTSADTVRVHAKGGATINHATSWGNLRFINYATTVVTDCTGGGIIDNLADATIDFQNDADATSTVNNAGTLLKSSGTGLSEIGILNNTGLVEVHSGTLKSVGGTSTGRFTVPEGSKLILGGAWTGKAVHNLNPGAIITGAGSVQFSNSTTNLDCDYAISGTTELASGTLMLKRDMSVSTFVFTDGTLDGPGKLLVSGPMTWNSGVMKGTGTTSANAPLAIAGKNTKIIDGRTLEVASAATWMDSGNISMGSATTVKVLPGATFDIKTDADLNRTSRFVSQLKLENAGTFRKSSGSAVTQIDAAFANTGTVEALTGTLHFTGGYTQMAGATRLMGGSITATDALLLQGGSLEGAGVIGAAVTSNAMISPGTGPGSLTIKGNLTLLGNSELAMDIGGAMAGIQYDTLSVTGAVTLGGVLHVTTLDGFDSQVSPLNSYTILTTTSDLMGAFDNIASGQRLLTSDGLGSFLVNYSAATRSVVLSDFQPVPEPSAILWAVLSIGLLARVRRRTPNATSPQSR